MNEGLTLQPDELEREGAAPAASPPPRLADLSPDSRCRVRRFIVEATLARGASGELVAGVYADIAHDDGASRYLDTRYLLRQMPPDWRATEDEVLDLAEAAQQRGVDLAALWYRARDIAAGSGEDPLDALRRLAGVSLDRRASRSIFDDPDEDALGPDEDALHGLLVDRLPDLADLAPSAQEAIRLYLVEERLENGLAPSELMELYRRLELEADVRARQYLDRVYVEGESLSEWRAIQARADEVRNLAERRSRDAGRLFAQALRSAGGMPTLDVLDLVRDQLLRG